MRQNSKMNKILVVHGPNLQLLGSREPQVYGKTSLKQINAELNKLAKKYKVGLEIVQSNYEGQICDLIGKAKNKFSAILINPAAYTHTSIAIRDAIAGSGLPCVEVHLSNIYSREEFRHKSLISPVAKGTIMGFGPKSYYLGLGALLDLLKP
jgi:3-dehydroquinate dehydratase II